MAVCFNKLPSHTTARSTGSHSAWRNYCGTITAFNFNMLSFGFDMFRWNRMLHASSEAQLLICNLSVPLQLFEQMAITRSRRIVSADGTALIECKTSQVRSKAFRPAWSELKNHCEEAAANVARPPVQEKRSVRPFGYYFVVYQYSIHLH